MSRAPADQAPTEVHTEFPTTPDRGQGGHAGGGSKGSLSPGLAPVVPILALLGLVQASVWLPGSLSHPVLFWISTGLLLTLPLLFWHGYPRSVLTPVSIYIASVCCLNIAAAPNSGLGLLLLLPVVGVALNASRAESAVTIGAVLVAAIILGLFDDITVTAMARRAALYCGISIVITFAIATLREPLIRSRRRAKLLLKDAEAMNDMARRLAVLTDPASIKRTAAELAATVGSPPESAWRRGVFLKVDHGVPALDSQFDQFEAPGSGLDVGWPSADDPLVEQAIRTGEVSSGEVHRPEAESNGSAAPKNPNTSYATWVPVKPNGQLAGLLGVASQGAPVPETSVDQLVGLGHLVELALSNWAAHEELEGMATREDRRRIARELHDGLAQELAFIASKTTASSLSGGSPEAIQQLADAAYRALDEARRAIVVLSEVPEDLHVSIIQTVEDLTARYGMTARLDIAQDIVLPGGVTENLLRVVREAITNASRHGHASTVSVQLARDGCFVRLVITDDGEGFDDRTRHEGDGFGLKFMEERCALIGAKLDVRSRVGNGTSIEVRRAI